MLDFDWKGNVRQLKNVVESLVVMDLDGILGVDDLSPDLIDEQPVIESGAIPLTAIEDRDGLVGRSLKEIERWAIENTLKLTGGNREETSTILGISERNLYRKLNEYELR